VEFSMPVRVRWDVDFGGRVGRPKRIARQIREIAPLAVDLRIDGERGMAELSAVFTEINKCGAKVGVTAGLSRRSAKAVRWGYPVELVWDIGAGGPFRGLLPDGARAVSFTPDEDTIGALPDVLADFAESAASELRLPNVNAVRAVAAKGHVPVPRSGQVRDTCEEIARSAIDLAGKKLVVHDYFLWKALRGRFPEAVGDRLEFAGCQAGATLVHVDWDGNVYPCDSLPIRLGNLLETPFERIWRSPAREKVFAAIRATPGACERCGAYEGCLGGCRGLVYAAHDSFDARDPACPGTVSGGSGKIPREG
jgi:radical SAM protein with 4Fe4S-binding SPASM domain